MLIIMNLILYGMIFMSLFAIDYALGNGFTEIFQMTFCKVVCFIKRSVKEEAMKAARYAVKENPVSLPMVLLEILVLSLAAAFLRKYKELRGRDRFDELFHESKEALRRADAFLEKWRQRRVLDEASYLDDEPQEIKPLKLEVPILHMAIVDTKGTTRGQPEGGDAGDTINITDSTLLSVTSINDEVPEPAVEPFNEDKSADNKNFRAINRYLWDVMEEDVNNLED